MIVQRKWRTFAAIPLISAFATNAYAESHLCGAPPDSAESEKTMSAPEREAYGKQDGLTASYEAMRRRLQTVQQRFHGIGQSDCIVDKTEEKAIATIAPSDYPTGMHESKAPFPTEEFWRKVRSLLMANKGEVTPADVEKVFGFKLEYGEFEDGSGHYYRLKSENAWYRHIQIMNSNDQRISIFKIKLSKYPFIYQSQNYCVKKNYIKEDLSRSSWKLYSEDDSYGYRGDSYINGDYMLHVKLDGCCVEEITLQKTS